MYVRTDAVPTTDPVGNSDGQDYLPVFLADENVSTPDHFQGNEDGVIFICFVVDDDQGVLDDIAAHPDIQEIARGQALSEYRGIPHVASDADPERHARREGNRGDDPLLGRR